MKKSFYTFLIIVVVSISIGMTIKSNPRVEIIEGFYKYSWENSSFNQIRNKKVYKNLWAEFDKDFQNISSINFKKISKEKLSNGVYLKVEGIKTGGGNYGHLGASDSLLTITKIIEIDTTQTINDFLKNVGK